MDDWTPEQRPVAPELVNPRDHAFFEPPPLYASWAEKFDNASGRTWVELAKGVR
jgi:hypothetical protein